MTMKKRLAALMMVAAMMAMTAMTALAANVTMYGKMGDSYVASSHTAAFVGDIEDLGDGTYMVTFVKATVYGQEGYIREMTINGETFEANGNGTLEAIFEYQPEDLGNITGQPITYAVTLEESEHPNSEGALVITE